MELLDLESTENFCWETAKGTSDHGENGFFCQLNFFYLTQYRNLNIDCAVKPHVYF